MILNLAFLRAGVQRRNPVISTATLEPRSSQTDLLASCLSLVYNLPFPPFLFQTFPGRMKLSCVRPSSIRVYRDVMRLPLFFVGSQVGDDTVWGTSSMGAIMRN